MQCAALQNAKIVIIYLVNSLNFHIFFSYFSILKLAPLNQLYFLCTQIKYIYFYFYFLSFNCISYESLELFLCFGFC